METISGSTNDTGTEKSSYHGHEESADDAADPTLGLPTLAQWRESEVPVTDSPPVEEMVAKVRDITGASRLAALTATLGAVTAAGGPRFKARAMGLELSSSLHTCFLGTDSLCEKTMLRIPFDPLRSIVRTGALKGSTLRFQTIEEVERSVGESLMTEEEKKWRDEYERAGLEDADRYGSNPGSNTGEFDDGTLTGAYRRASGYRSRTAPKPSPQELEATAARVGRAIHPLALAEPFMPDQFASYREITGDLGVYSVDPFGIGMEAMLKASRATRGKGLEFLRASYDGAPVVQGRALAPPWITTLTRCGKGTLAELWGNPEFRESGVLFRTLFINLEDEAYSSLRILAINDSCPAFEQLVKDCYFKQVHRDQVVLNFAPDCAPPWEAFPGDLTSLRSELPDMRPFIEFIPHHVVKLALALHIGASTTVAGSIPGARLAQAIDILRLAAGSSLAAISQAMAQTATTGSLDENVRVLVSKVRSKGPISRRDLLRSYHDIRAVELTPIISEALSRKLIVEKSEGFVAVGHLC